MRRAETVWVRNNGKLPYVDRYDGEDFTIKPGEYMEMDVEAARLCLGLGEDDKTRALRRLGWVKSTDGMPEAMARLNSFSFHMKESEAEGHLSAPVGAGTAGAALSGVKPAGSGSSKRVGERAPVDDETGRQQVNALDQLAVVEPAG